MLIVDRFGNVLSTVIDWIFFVPFSDSQGNGGQKTRGGTRTS